MENELSDFNTQRLMIAARIRALKTYNSHTQLSPIDFIHYVVKSFPFRIKMIRTDNGHGFQTKFHC